ncbi:MAG: NTP transferase domain-containing protein [Ignavibacteriales bacterium]|nr:NTP transferase domain-containing protein [Ignavibacteriales bacterium]
MVDGRKKKIICGVLIAAGFSGRMNEFKPLMMYNGSSFVVEIIRKMQTVCDRIVLVTGYQNEKVQFEIEKYFSEDSSIVFAFNPDYEKGMFTSLQRGLKEAVDADWVLYHFVDQPGLTEVFYKEFIMQIEKESNWIQPVFAGRKGHPILLASSIFLFITNASQEDSLKNISLIPGVKKKFWNCNHSQVLQDIDTPEDYKREIENEHI